MKLLLLLSVVNVLNALKRILTVFVVHLPDLPCVAALLDNIVVELIPKTGGSEFWPRDLGEWIKIHAINIQPNNIQDE